LAHPPLGAGDWEPWQTLLRAAAANPLVHAKVSGLYPPGADWTAADIRPCVEFAVEVFGPGRLMFGSDWPVAELSGGYQRVWTAITGVLAGFPAADRDAILGGTAASFYRLEGP
jgi:L-fuconolactonase